jgi:hypothetical protein
MPLDKSLRDTVDAYCKQDLPGDMQWHVHQFAFIADAERGVVWVAPYTQHDMSQSLWKLCLLLAMKSTHS